MQIIFSNDIESIQDKYIVLQLDTFRMPAGELRTAWAVVGSVPLSEFMCIDADRELHRNLIVEYQSRNWEYCKQAIEHLKGRWNKDLDSFYDNLLLRIEKHSVDNVPDLDLILPCSVHNLQSN